MSDIPSRLSQWEPSRALKVGFLIAAALSIAALFASKIYANKVVWPRRIEDAARAERLPRTPAPKLAVTDLEGRPVSLEAHRGKVVFVNFWATWCEPCREEMPSLAQLARSLNPADVVFLAVSVDETTEPVRGFFGPGALPFEVWHDPEGAVARTWGTEKFPESWVIDPDGNLLYRFVGARDWASTATRKVLEQAGVRRLPPAPKPQRKS